MASYFTSFSLMFPLPDEAARRYALELHQQADRLRQEEDVAGFPADLRDQIEDWAFEAKAEEVEGRPGLWLHSSEGGIDAVCAFLRHLLQKFDPAGRVPFEWSHDCSQPRTDAYGGGAALVTATEIKTMSTHQWLQAQAA